MKLVLSVVPLESWPTPARICALCACAAGIPGSFVMPFKVFWRGSLACPHSGWSQSVRERLRFHELGILAVARNQSHAALLTLAPSSDFADADVFAGLSVPNVLTPEMLLSMRKSPLIFALSNPTPEIDYQLAVRTRSDVIMGTGRSDLPNQINNVCAFPYIFRCVRHCVRCASSNQAKRAFPCIVSESRVTSQGYHSAFASDKMRLCALSRVWSGDAVC